ncbi:hypothetical protein G0U57_021542 [Chelydra serpentina]|uniref:Uncharacterized protein n=1 Tax=Chelydra serpentina TaxID=8475 RepID=A0A8T1ST57_CHESE|nr:hypothetical protein G0U57_021542 [Chelydra serpentina]
MHPFPCSALLTCFGSVRENTPFDQIDVNTLAAEVQKAEMDSMICMQPSAKGASSESHRGENTREGMFQASSCSEKHSSANSNSSNHVVAQPAPTPTDSSMLPDNEPDHDTITVQTYLPRPSIIGVPKVSALNADIWSDRRSGSLINQSIKSKSIIYFVLIGTRRG